jgi:phosphohistidine phosphatase SixA
VLSAIGIARTTALDSAVRDFGITDVVVSHLQRTRLTAAAVIARVSPTVHIVPIGSGGVAAHARAVADTVRAIAQRPGHGGVLVVGHSNTVTPIVEALGGGALRELCDSQYSQFFEVQLVASGPSRLRRATYGATDPVDATCAGMAAPR